MLGDAKEIPGGATLQADVCIIGGGPAGISLAREFSDSAVQVCLLESGGFDEARATQDLNAGTNVGLPYFELHETRYRALGGSTHRWAGWCHPLHAEDFEFRSWMPRSGWPLAAEDLDPYYRRAEQLCQIENSRWEPEAWGKAVPALYRTPFVGAPVEAFVWQGSPPTKFGAVYRKEIEHAGNIACYLHATALELVTNDEGTAVSAARVAGPDGREFRVHATSFILTAGALETARLLLVSNRSRSAGLGNDHDNVGRYFMEHPHVVTGQIRLHPSSATSRPRVRSIDAGLFGARARLKLQRPTSGIRCGYTLSRQEQRDADLLNYSAHLITVNELDGDNSEAYKSLRLLVGNLRSPRGLWTQIRQGALPTGWRGHVKNVVSHAGKTASTVYREFFRRPETLGIYTQAEQSPNPDSRVTLGDGTDRFGVPQLQLQWQLSAVDKISIRRSQKLVGARLESAGVGILEPDPWLLADDDSWSPNLTGGHHQMGTARMSTDPRHGVTDANGQVHGVANLYVADGSLFPTSGFANPLLTIVALALRCADHVKQRLGHGRA